MSNPGPASSQIQQAVAPMTNVQKSGVFNLVISPASVGAATTAVQNFASTGIGLQVGDQISVSVNGPQTAGIVIANAYCVAADQLTIQFGNVTAGGVVPVAGTAAAPYVVSVQRVMPLSNTVVVSPQLSW